MFLIHWLMPKGIKLVRALREGWMSFRRNGWLSVSTVLVMSLALFIIGFSSVLAMASQSILSSFEKKIDITISFNSDVSEEKILAVKSELEKYREVSSVVYTSSDDALAKFLKESETSGRKDVIDRALEEVDGNPLLSSLTVNARSPEDYSTINAALESASFRSDIYDINYRENQKIIERLNAIHRGTIRIGGAFGAIFLFIAFLVAFHTIRLTMHARREDFEIMRLVGASNLYVRTPSVTEGMLYGFAASLLSLTLLLGTFFGLDSFSRGALDQYGFVRTFLSHAVLVSVGLIGVGLFVGGISGFIAVRRYLKV